MLTDREEKVVAWLRRRQVATMRQMRQQFDISHMTVVRALGKHGYFTSYDHNAGYYTLRETPQFDDWGLWTFRDIHFSKHGTLKNTLAALVEQAPAGRTTRELASRLHGDVTHVLSRLVKKGRLRSQPLAGRQVVYLSADTERGQEQWRQRQAEPAPEVAAAVRLPAGMAAGEVIAVLRQMILRPKDGPEQWAKQLSACHIAVSAAQVQQVIDHYALEKKRQR